MGTMEQLGDEKTYHYWYNLEYPEADIGSYPVYKTTIVHNLE